MKLRIGTLFGKKYHIVDSDHTFWAEDELDFRTMINWCNETFGLRENNRDGIPNGLPRWTINNAAFWFKDEKDQILFVLRWS